VRDQKAPDRLRNVNARWLAIAAIMLAAGVLGAFAGCGGDDDEPSQEEFGEQLRNIVEEPSQAFERLAQEGRQLKPADPLPEEFRAQIGAVGETMAAAAGELEELSPPEDAEEPTQELIDAIRARAEAFEQAAGDEDITLREFAPTLRETGERVDQAFEALRELGYLPEPEPGA
jgi:hypothetical protein